MAGSSRFSAFVHSNNHLVSDQFGELAHYNITPVASLMSQDEEPERHHYAKDEQRDVRCDVQE